MSKEQLIEVFRDTENLYENKYVDDVKNCCTQTFIYQYDFSARKTNKDYSKGGIYEEPAQVLVSNIDTLSAAKKYSKLNKTLEDETYYTAILNFASATNPGGGVLKGSSAQEECLCRCTTLYPALCQVKCFGQYYNLNRLENDNRGSDKIIYTREVLVLKDKDYNLLPEDEMFKVDVITCAAPNLRDYPANYYNQNAPKTKLVLSDEELYDIHVKRARYILESAIDNEISHLILGAFGCGAFKNNPEIVAKAYKDVIGDYKYYFKVIEFAIVGKNNNFEIFNKIINEQ